MDNNLYDMIFKRKSFHLFRNIGNEHITEEELKDIENEFNNFKPYQLCSKLSTLYCVIRKIIDEW